MTDDSRILGDKEKGDGVATPAKTQIPTENNEPNMLKAILTFLGVAVIFTFAIALVAFSMKDYTERREAATFHAVSEVYLEFEASNLGQATNATADAARTMYRKLVDLGLSEEDIRLAHFDVSFKRQSDERPAYEGYFVLDTKIWPLKVGGSSYEEDPVRLDIAPALTKVAEQDERIALVETRVLPFPEYVTSNNWPLNLVQGTGQKLTLSVTE